MMSTWNVPTELASAWAATAAEHGNNVFVIHHSPAMLRALFDATAKYADQSTTLKVTRTVRDPNTWRIELDNYTAIHFGIARPRGQNVLVLNVVDRPSGL